MVSPTAGYTAQVFCPPPLGKPNPKLPRPPLSEVDNRERVVQAAQKSFNCWDYGYNAIRLRCKAPNISPENCFERKIERAASDRRKLVSLVYQDYRPFLGLDEKSRNTCRSYTKDSLSQRKSSTPFGMLHDGKFIDMSKEAASFIKQTEYSNFYDYAVSKHLKRLLAINERFLKQCGTTAVDAYDQKVDGYSRFEFDLPGDLRKADLQLQHVFSDAMCRIKFIDAMHMKPTNWTPKSPCSLLVQELQQYGPLVFSGFFGESYHSEPAQIMGEVNGKPVYGWSKKKQKGAANRAIMTHCIVVVGAGKQGDEDVVYYINPKNKSDPADPASQKIHVLPYALLTDYDLIATHMGVQMQGDFPSSFIYALRGPTLAELKNLPNSPAPVIESKSK